MKPLPKSPRRHLVFAALLALGGGMRQALAMARPPSTPATPLPTSAITTISIERNCFGCTTGSVLTLHRDGRATYTVTGSARSGTADKTSTGTLAADAFDRLARLAVSTGFFALNERYEDPQTRDGAWVTTTISRDGQDKQVFRREDAGPPGLGALEADIDASKARIRFDP